MHRRRGRSPRSVTAADRDSLRQLREPPGIWGCRVIVPSSRVDDVTPGEGGEGRAQDRGLARPERPSFEDVTPAPVTGPAARTRVADRTLTALWWSTSLLVFAALTLFLTRKTAQDNLAGLLLLANPALDVVSIEGSVARIIDVVLAILVFLATLVAVSVSSLSRGRRWPRILLIPTGLVQLCVAVPTALLAPHGSWQGWLVTVALLLGVLSTLGGTALAWAPSMSRWLAQRRAVAGTPR